MVFPKCTVHVKVHAYLFLRKLISVVAAIQPKKIKRTTKKIKSFLFKTLLTTR